MKNLISQIKKEMEMMDKLGMNVPAGAFKDENIKSFFKDFKGGNRALSQMIDLYLLKG